MPGSIKEIYESMEYGPALEDAAEVRRWLNARSGARWGRVLGHFIGGAWTPPGLDAKDGSAESFTTVDPATGEPLATVEQADAATVDRAVGAARAALPGWQALTGHGRARYLYAFARGVQKHARRLAVLETRNNGKPIRESRDADVPLAVRHFYYHAGWAQLLDGVAEGRAEEFRGYVPVGVVGAIVPRHVPLLLFAWKVAPALAAGCTVVLKPAESTPPTAVMMAEIAEEIGLPAGVLNVVQGDGRAGALLVEHPEVDKITFTGSTAVGRLIREATAATAKRLSLGLGGKSPFLVFDDADLDSAVEGLVDGILCNGGQAGWAGSRLLVQERVAERLFAKLRARMSTLRVGNPLDKANDFGAIADKSEYERILRYIEAGVREGATCWQPKISLPEKGLFMKPTLLTGVSPASTVAQEEISGPVLAAMTFRTPAEAVELANNTGYGLAASIWSENVNVALEVAAGVKAGVVWVNATNVFDAACGFGGYRESGFGRDGGKEGMWEYLEPAWLRGVGAGGADEIVTRLPEPAVGSEFGGVFEVIGISGPTLADGAGKDGAPGGIAMLLRREERAERGLREGPPMDRTVKLYIGGRQVRPEGGYSFPVYAADGVLVGQAPLGSRKDVRNAVEAARAAAVRWARRTAHGRAQVLFFVAENLVQRRDEIVRKLAAFVGEAQAAVEFDMAAERCFSYAAWCDKYEGSVHQPSMRMVAIAMQEPVGVIGLLASDEAPLLGLLSLILPAVAMGNTVVAVPSAKAATLMADLYQVFDTSDVPGGVVNLVAGGAMDLGKTLAEHEDVDAVWSFRDEAVATMVNTASVGNLKQTWALYNSVDGRSRAVDWFDPAQGEGRWFLRHATQGKTVWVPFGE